MSVTFESVRFGTVEISEEEVIEFPRGLVGLGGLNYTLLNRNPGTDFRWLHCVEDPALALPVVPPERFFPDFTLELSDEDRAEAGIEDLSRATVYVTVRADPNPFEITANLRAPLVILAGRGFQLINTAPDAPLQAPLFEPAPASEAAQTASADAA
jgi:flagellar assembly factor FliW